MHKLVFAFEVLAAIVILVRAVYIGSQVSFRDWDGHPMQFILVSLSYPLLAGGAVGILVDRHAGYVLLLIGVAFHLLSERRKPR